MMNRSTQKELIKLMLQLNEMWPQLDLSNSEQQNMVLDILDTISAKCQKDFSKTNADWYVDTMESLGQVIKMTDWHNMGREELTQCISLCQDIILQVINNLRTEKELKKDIVFLPYKASMWDSLESVWKVAYADKEHCNTYVIPIPYCDRNPDGSVAQWHCELGEFPDYVPVLDWNAVDLKEWHPNVIFFHYPYDNLNRVTSVESRFYSRNLKECTDKLVYIPYFVLGEPCSEEDASGFILQPGVVNADRVIVQSEAMRKLYIDILSKNTDISDREIWEKRISGEGSPKIDKVLNSKREDFDMPNKWRKLAEGKKIILYNTSLSAMLNNSDKVCAKIRYVFDIFRKRDDMVLWWRPHPLMKSTFHSMRPQYEEEYLCLEKKYIDEGWGIYDNSSDLHRAICWSDAYYGDDSSVVPLYMKTGKPLMVQDFCLTSARINDNMCQGSSSFLDAVHTRKNCITYFDLNHSSIVEYDINKNMAHIKRLLKCSGGIAGIYNIQDEWFLVSQFEEKIFVLDSSFLEVREYQLTKKWSNHAIVMYNDCIFGLTIGIRGDDYCFDCHTKKFLRYDALKRSIHANGIDDAFLGVYINRFNNILSMVLPKSKIVLIWDLEKENLKAINIGDTYKIASAIYDGEGLWITQIDSSDILYWDMEKKSYTDKIQIDGEFAQIMEPYSSLIVYREYFIALPRCCDDVVVINRKTRKSSFFSIIHGEHDWGGGSAIVGYTVHEDCIYLYPNAISKFYILDLKHMRIVENNFNFKREEILMCFTMCRTEEIPLWEKGSGVAMFLDWLPSVSNEVQSKNKKSVTKTIWGKLL